MSAYTLPGLFPPLPLGASFCGGRFGLPLTLPIDAEIDPSGPTQTKQHGQVKVTVQHARIDTATLIHALLLSSSQQTNHCQRNGSRLVKTPSAAGERHCLDEDAVHYELSISGVRVAKDDDCTRITCKRSLSQIVRLYHDLLDEDDDEGEHDISKPGDASISELPFRARKIPALPRLQDQENKLFPTGGVVPPDMAVTTGFVGRGFVVLQELLRSQVPQLQDWLNQVLVVADPKRSTAWKHFLRDDESDYGSLSIQSFSSSSRLASCEKLGAIEESESEYDCEDACDDGAL